MASPTIPTVRGGGPHIDYSSRCSSLIKLDGRLSASVARAAAEHPTRPRGACPWSSRERTSKARTAFLVAPLAMIDGECMVLDGPALISTCCHSALAARAATGAPTVTAVTLCVVRVDLCVPFRATWLELYGSDVTGTLLTLSRVCRYARIFLTPTT